MSIEIYQEIEEFSELQFSLKEIAVLIEKDIEFFKPGNEAYLAFMRGRLRAQAQVRKSILQMAKQGSSPAQKQFQDLAVKSETNYELSEENPEPKKNEEKPVSQNHSDDDIKNLLDELL